MNDPLLWTLIAIQIAMGAFDTLYHHEWTERLPWRPSQRTELRLHAVRNWFYALIFLTLGWLEVRGTFAVTIIAILLAEVLITLWDFVEEDLSRRLPATERVNHTLLALNYGAILVLLLPVLGGWAGEGSSLTAVFYGAWSLLATASAIAVFVFGLRDWAAAERSERLAGDPPAPLVDALGQPTKVLVTGATGFIGQRLVEALAAAGHEVTVLVRDPARATLLAPPFRLITDLAQIPDTASIDVVVNLAGEPIANGLWTREKRRRMIGSRVSTTTALADLVRRLERKPKVLVNGSAIGWYGLREDEALGEDAAAAPCFSHELCEAWERSTDAIAATGLRVVLLRIGIVLGTQGGALARLLTPFEFFAGGPMGSGRQWMSWIERDDLIRLIAHAIATETISGPLNATAPTPVRNEAFAAALAKALGRPSWLRAPAWPLHRLGGDFAEELLLSGQKVLPAKALATGFHFRHDTVDGAFNAMLGIEGPQRSASGAISDPRSESRV